jgi:hypothetical protein
MVARALEVHAGVVLRFPDVASILISPPTTVTTKSMVLWAVTLCSSMQFHQHYCHLLIAGFLLGILFNPEDGGNTFL